MNFSDINEEKFRFNIINNSKIETHMKSLISFIFIAKHFPIKYYYIIYNEIAFIVIANK
jgi:hypothetical protein